MEDTELSGFDCPNHPRRPPHEDALLSPFLWLWQGANAVLDAPGIWALRRRHWVRDFTVSSNSLVLHVQSQSPTNLWNLVIYNLIMSPVIWKCIKVWEALFPIHPCSCSINVCPSSLLFPGLGLLGQCQKEMPHTFYLLPCLFLDVL
jgi:hypothetical protein